MLLLHYCSLSTQRGVAIRHSAWQILLILCKDTVPWLSSCLRNKHSPNMTHLQQLFPNMAIPTYSTNRCLGNAHYHHDSEGCLKQSRPKLPPRQICIAVDCWVKHTVLYMFESSLQQADLQQADPAFAVHDLHSHITSHVAAMCYSRSSMRSSRMRWHLGSCHNALHPSKKCRWLLQS